MSGRNEVIEIYKRTDLSAFNPLMTILIRLPGPKFGSLYFMQSKYIILCVVGARPNFMKIAPIMQAMQQSALLEPSLVHTGQHYDQAMKDAFFQELGIPEPDYDLGVGSGSHGQQTAEIMLRFEPILDQIKPSAILVVGDVNSTIATALVASKKSIPIIHVEAGLRSYDRQMPEEINRVLTDQISDRLYTTELEAQENLLREGVASDRIVFAGNVMIDTLLQQTKRARSLVELTETLSLNTPLQKDSYALLTLHRPANVDDPEVLTKLLTNLSTVSEKIKIIFPMHPRTQNNVELFGLTELLNSANIATCEPLGYLELLGLMQHAKMVLTDSGGLQEESTALGIPCLTLRPNTERPITVKAGTNTIVNLDTEKLNQCVQEILETGGKQGHRPDLWDGQAAKRIVADIERWLQETK